MNITNLNLLVSIVCKTHTPQKIFISITRFKWTK